MTTPELPAARLAVLDHVRQGRTTVNALAAALGVTDNAVRLHLSALERDQFIRRRGVQRSGGAGQPAAEYELTNAGEIALSSAYPHALSALVASIGDKLDPRTKRSVFADAGRRLAHASPSPVTGTVSERAHACAALIESLGGKVSVNAHRTRATITGTGCPLASAVRAEPGACIIIEALLAARSGLTVTQRCEHGDRPACKFELAND